MTQKCPICDKILGSTKEEISAHMKNHCWRPMNERWSQSFDKYVEIIINFNKKYPQWSKDENKLKSSGEDLKRRLQEWDSKYKDKELDKVTYAKSEQERIELQKELQQWKEITQSYQQIQAYYLTLKQGMKEGLLGIVLDIKDRLKNAYCNRLVIAIVEKLDIHDFTDMDANHQIKYMVTHQNIWKKIDVVNAELEAQNEANKGNLVIAGWSNDKGSGHTCVVIPGQMSDTGEKNAFPSSRAPCVASGGKEGESSVPIVLTSANNKFTDKEKPTYFLRIP